EEVAAWLHQANDIQTEVTSLVHQRYPDELITELTDGDLDLGLCRAIEPPHGIARTLLGHHRLRVAMSVEHHLATTEQLRLQELANERILVWGEPGRSGYTDLLIDYCRQTGGFEPHVERTARQGMPPVTAVAKSNDVGFVTHERALQRQVGCKSRNSNRQSTHHCTHSGTNILVPTIATCCYQRQPADRPNVYATVGGRRIRW